ncbi:MAG: LytTR family transcriptional regulator DNA-binding domain-containing protein, partial [Pseudomonadota bacterium]
PTHPNLDLSKLRDDLLRLRSLAHVSTPELEPRLTQRPDHFAGGRPRVYTPAGSDLVLSTFEDALRAVSGIPGVQTHRSWWAAAADMKHLKRSGSSFEFELKSGLNVPVGRRRRSAIQIILDQTEAGQARRADD